MEHRILSVGKRRGLSSTSDERGVFNILAFDHRQSFVRMVNSSLVENGIYETAASIKLEVIQELSHAASAVLTDPLYGAAQALAGDALPAKTGLLVAVEKSGYYGKSTARTTQILEGWGVEKIKRMGADAVKLLIYYHPEGGDLTNQQEDLIKQVVEQCRNFDIAFFLEPVTYSLDSKSNKKSEQFAESRPDLIARTAERLSALEPDVLKLEFPVDANINTKQEFWLDACSAVTEASTCPWTVLSAGVAFEIFIDQVEVACEAGASGFIGGRAIWKEGIRMHRAQRKEWLKTTAWDRLQKLKRISYEKATPWRNYYPAEGVGPYQNWYKNY